MDLRNVVERIRSYYRNLGSVRSPCYRGHVDIQLFHQSQSFSVRVTLTQTTV